MNYFRVARWYVFKPKNRLWVNYGGLWNEKSWYILWQYLTVIWYILWPFGILAEDWYNFPSFRIMNKEKYDNPKLLPHPHPSSEGSFWMIFCAYKKKLIDPKFLPGVTI
jgi:hypothetical protein